ncbi:MAG: hypothetical protein AB8B58_03425 [Roseobacter sp.]
MESILIGIFGIALLIILVWLYIILPMEMANRRHRSPTVWVLISFVGSPLLAILLLIALGPAETDCDPS